MDQILGGRPIVSLLRSIPDRWGEFEYDQLSAAGQHTLFLLVAAGLVERRMTVRGEFAGQATSVGFTFDVTGEYGLVEAIESAVAEMWTKWGPVFEAWKASDAKDSKPFRFTRTGVDRWQLTEFGVMARSDLDVEAPSAGAAAIVGSYQRTIEFVSRTGHQTDRPGVSGNGRLLELKVTEPAEQSTVSPTPVSLANSHELAAAFRDALIPGLIEALDGRQTSSNPPTGTRKPGTGMPIAEVILSAEAHVKARGGAYPGRNKLAKMVGCSTSSITKAVERSPYLKAREAEHNSANRGSSPERQSSQAIEELAYDCDWKSAEAERDAALDQLIAEQEAEQMREEAQRKRAQRRRDGA